MNRWLLLGAFVALAWSLAAQEEAPDYQLTPSGTERLSKVEASGTWTARSSLGWVGGWNASGFVPTASYRDVVKGFVFAQVPDFSLGVRLLDRYFFRVVYTGSVDNNSFELGYDGLDGEALRWVRAGNTPFDVPARAGTTLPVGRTGNPAVGLGWSLGELQGEVVARFEDNTRETRDYRGFTALDVGSVALTDWLRGQFVQLPGPGPWSSLELRLEDASTALGYRVLGPGDYRLGSGGELDLVKSVDARLWALWGGHPSLLLVYDPGQDSGWERRNHYALPSGLDPRSRAFVANTDTGEAQDGYTVSVNSAGHWVEVSPSVSEVSARNANLEIRFVPPTSSATNWVLGADVIASSVVVSRNGLETPDWSFDASSGTITPQFAVSATDAIHIVFQRRQKSGKSADALGWWGATWKPSPTQTVEANAWVLWNTVRDRYTLQEGEAPGQVQSAVRWQGSSGPLAWSLRTEASARWADSTGHRRLLGLDSAGLQASLSSESLRPAQAPLVALGGLTLGPANRGVALYRDFSTLDPLTGSTVLGSWNAAQPSLPTTDGGYTGPYLVGGDGDGIRAVVLEGPLATGQWSGFQVFLDSGADHDLGARSRLQLALRLTEALPPSVRVFLLVGELGENFDGSGAVKTVLAGTRPSLAFRDEARGATLSFPVPEGTSWTNDGNTDGVPSNGGTPLVLELTSGLGGFDGASTQWQTLDLALNEGQRALLTRTKAWGIVVTSTSATTVSPRLLVRSLTFAGSSWDVVPVAQAPGTVAVRDLVDAQAGNTTRVDWTSRPDWSMTARFSTFHPREFRRLNWSYQLAPGASSPSMGLQFWGGGRVGAEYHWTPVVGSASTLVIDLATGVLTDGTTTVQPSVWNPDVTSWNRITWTYSGQGDGSLVLSPPEAVDPLWNVGLTTDADAVLTLGANRFKAHVVDTLSELGGHQIQGQTEWSTRLGPLSGTWLADWNASGLQHTGYTVDAAAAWSEGGVSARLGDALSDRLTRRLSGELKVPVLGSLSASAQGLWTSDQLEQNYEARWSVGGPADRLPLLALSADARLASPGTEPVADWSTLWWNSLDWLVPEAGVHASTWEHATTALTWNPGALGLQLGGGAQVLQLAGSPWSTTSSWNASLALPWVVASDDPWGVTPQLEAKWTSSWTQDAGLDPVALAALAAQRLAGDWTALGDFRGELVARLEATKAPLRVSLSSSWTQGTEASSPYTAARQSLALSSRWENLFGRSGTWPLFGWYRNDSWKLQSSATLLEGTRSADNGADLSLLWEPEIFFSGVERLAWPSQATWKAGATSLFELQTGPVWRWHGPARLPFVLPEWMSPPTFARDLGWETASDLVWSWDGSTWGVRQWQVSEKATLTLSPKSEAHLTLRWGNGWQSGLFVTALDAALDVVLAF